MVSAAKNYDVQRLVDAVLNSVGDTKPEDRQAAEAYTARLSGAQRAPMGVAPELAAYLEKVGLTPFAITDGDILGLKAAGFSEDAIFELTISGALGAGLARLEKVTQLIEGEYETGDIDQE